MIAIGMARDDMAERIRRARLSERLTQQDIGTACGVSGAAVSQWENGETKNMKPAHLFKAAKKLRRNPQWLALGEGPEMAASDPQREAWAALYDLMSPNKRDEVFRLLGDAPDQQAK